MTASPDFFEYQKDGVTFTSKVAAQMRLIYAPLSGPDAKGLKSAITPFLSGDIKIDKTHYLTKPASREDLRTDVRNFFVYIHNTCHPESRNQADPSGSSSAAQLQNDKAVHDRCSHAKVYSLNKPGHEDSFVEIGQLWHRVVRKFPQAGLEIEAVNFVPVSGENVEVMKVTVRNAGAEDLTYTPTAVLPIFGRSLENKHDHEHVTALLNRTRQLREGVYVEPTMRFNEEGHKENRSHYFVFGISGQQEYPVGTFPAVDRFCGEGGSLSSPEAVVKNTTPRTLGDAQIQGKETVGALRFREEHLKPGQAKDYFIVAGIVMLPEDAERALKKFGSAEGFTKALEEVKKFWQQKTAAVTFGTADRNFNAFMKWVTLQPVLRRIWGCSFLPDHDYGKGGKGWRDLWQDLLSLILIEPELVRDNLINNYGGLRIDGSNATIIGTLPGEFLADRNAITRVWMDHGVWPFLTTQLYIDQTGDYDLLFLEQSYFKDPQMSRTFERDARWNAQYGNKLKTTFGVSYTGTILEHILLQNLVQFFNVGEHNVIRLESADWNDGLDMGFKRGESVAFMSIYGGNLLAIADLLERLKTTKKVEEIELAAEILILLDRAAKDGCNYDQAEAKRERLFNKYFKAVQPEISGQKKKVSIDAVIDDLREKGYWIFEFIRRNEWITVQADGERYGWFNGYYDNLGQRVEGDKNGRIWMTLTGQVFALMSGLAKDSEIKDVIRSVRRFLKDPKLGGIRLNTDFGLRHYLDLGRAFGFAFGTKENGAFFSHMIVMYAFALYKRGFSREGYEILKSIYTMCKNTEAAKIYPGVPEYFDSEGRGMYHYLTGSASWWVLTQLTQAFGVRGCGGDLVLNPKLVREEFDAAGEAQVACMFAGKRLTVIYTNRSGKDAGDYRIKGLMINDHSVVFDRKGPAEIVVKRGFIDQVNGEVKIKVELE